MNRSVSATPGQRRHAAQALRGSGIHPARIAGPRADHGLRAAQVAGDTGVREVIGRELEAWRGPTQPDKGCMNFKSGRMAWRGLHPQKRARQGRRSNICSQPIEKSALHSPKQVHRLWRLRCGPSPQNALGLRGGGDGGHVVHRAGAGSSRASASAPTSLVTRWQFSGPTSTSPARAPCTGLRQCRGQSGGFTALRSRMRLRVGGCLASNVQRGAQHLVEG